jgi:hypothetical protein
MTWCVLGGEIFHVLCRLESTLYLPPKEGVANVIDIQSKCYALFLNRCLWRLEPEHTLTAAWSKLWNDNFYMAKALDMRTSHTISLFTALFSLNMLQEDRSLTHQMRILLQRPSTVWPQVWRNKHIVPVNDLLRSTWYRTIRDLILK